MTETSQKRPERTIDLAEYTTLPNLIMMMKANGPVSVISHVAEAVIARVVPPGHDMQVLHRAAEGRHKISILLQVAEWTGLGTLEDVVQACEDLTGGGVDLNFLPNWRELPPGRTYAVPDLILRNRLGRHHQAMLDSGHDPQAWLDAIDKINELIGKETHNHPENGSRVAGLACRSGMGPQQAAQRVQDLLATGVRPWNLDAAFGPEAPPDDLLARYGDTLVRSVKELTTGPLTRKNVYDLLHTGLTVEDIRWFLNGGVHTADAMAMLHREGVHPWLAPRARAEQLPISLWPTVLRPLAEAIVKDQYGMQVCLIRPKRGLYTLEEMSADGVMLPGRVAWDDPDGLWGSGPRPLDLPEALGDADRRALADAGVSPQLFSKAFSHLPGHGGYFSLFGLQVTPDHVEQVMLAASGGVTCELLDLMVLDATGPGGRAGSRVEMTGQQMARLAVLDPTPDEARFLGQRIGSRHGNRWIGRLEAWRLGAKEAEEVFTALRKGDETGPFLRWLVKAPSTRVFRAKNALRTQAVKSAAGAFRAATVMDAELIYRALRDQVLPEAIPPQHDSGYQQTLAQLSLLFQEIGISNQV